MKTGILFLNLGGPDSLKAVKPFLYNLFADPEIIRLPFSPVLQKPLAWLISTLRQKATQENYRLMGGRSPILPLTSAQAQGVKSCLAERGLDVSVYIAMRYWHPMTDAALAQMVRDGIEHVILLPLYPQYSLTTTGSSVSAFEEECRKQRIMFPKVSLIEHYYDDPGYQAALAAMVREALEEHEWGCPLDAVHFLFSAHSLPKSFVERTNDVYPAQIETTARLMMETHFPGHTWEIAYQSKIGRIPWLQPYTEEAIETLGKAKRDNVLMIPISFVSEHIETLYEIDLLYLPMAKEVGMRYCHRARALNDHPAFMEALADRVQASLRETPVEMPV